LKKGLIKGISVLQTCLKKTIKVIVTKMQL